MSLYYAGFNTSMLFYKDENVIFAVDSFTKISFPEITDFQIAWGYFLIWKGKELYIVRKAEENHTDTNMQLIQIPETAVNSDSENEYPVKILQGGCTVVLTNLGRAFNVPTLVEMPKRVQFIDVACGFDHTILCAQNGDIYSMGMGTRGQLGHGDLEDCDNPKLIEALAGIRVVQISAAGSHSAVVTEQGDLYTWGWNTNGELGLPNQESKVVAVPTLVDFTDDQNKNAEAFVKKVECGNNFTICMMDDGTLWGSGSNKYGQLGEPRDVLPDTPKFVKLKVSLNSERITDFKCREWGTMLITE
ncbi:RCC1 domain-containing protein 1 isoform X2 [Osmia lignaria lignaria]|uniref:RCC1 domain-containing protein 1 isoform X2 n=1 Tax=Osmia lignaria lignaria TaxID=1437193 RepID=UPI00402B339A